MKVGTPDSGTIFTDAQKKVSKTMQHKDVLLKLKNDAKGEWAASIREIHTFCWVHDEDNMLNVILTSFPNLEALCIEDVENCPKKTIVLPATIQNVSVAAALSSSHLSDIQVDARKCLSLKEIRTSVETPFGMSYVHVSDYHLPPSAKINICHRDYVSDVCSVIRTDARGKVIAET
jgi:hypothetical protein